jgi:hypothetical protein
LGERWLTDAANDLDAVDSRVDRNGALTESLGMRAYVITARVECGVGKKNRPIGKRKRYDTEAARTDYR